MSSTEIKYSLFKLIDAINDSRTLNKIYSLIKESVKKEDWWDTISEKEKSLIEKGLKQLKDGEGIPHTSVRKKVDKLLRK